MLDPLKQDIWFLPLMSVQWHLWKKGSETSACGLPWNVAASSFDARPAPAPTVGNENTICAKCLEGEHEQ